MSTAVREVAEAVEIRELEEDRSVYLLLFSVLGDILLLVPS